MVLLLNPSVCEDSASIGKIEWLPRGHSFPVPYLSPHAIQQSISALTYAVDGDNQQRLYAPITMSMRQQFIRKHIDENRLLELGMAFSIFSQFSIVDVGEAYMGGLQNADYRVSAILVYQRSSNTHLRVSLFHQSSHLGDDYIIRNSITRPTLRTLNFEQLDVTYSLRARGKRTYFGTGYNVSPHTVRKRLTFQWGGDYSKVLQHSNGLAHKLAFDTQIHAHNDYRPNLRLGYGLEIARNSRSPFIIMMSWYHGHLPYSTLEYQRVDLLGLSLFIDLPTRY